MSQIQKSIDISNSLSMAFNKYCMYPELSCGCKAFFLVVKKDDFAANAEMK